MNNTKGLHAQVKRMALALTVAAMTQSGAALSALELRDINGNATTIAADAEFAYDTVLDATWYLTANNTGLIWRDARNWAAGLTVGTFSGWSLPAADPSCGFNYFCTSSQMGELYYTALGNPADGPLSNTGPFKNLVQSNTYWTGTKLAPDAFDAWAFRTDFGVQDVVTDTYAFYALAIRPGDVAAVPEPGTVALLLSGLAGVLVMRRRSVKS